MFSRRRFPRLGRAAAACLVFLAAGPSRAADPAKGSVDPLLPKPQPAERYQALAARSPFAPPTAAPVVSPTPPPPPPPGWAEKYALGSVAQIGSGYRVTIASKTPGSGPNGTGVERLVIISGEENSERIAVGDVQWSDQPTQTRVTLVKNGIPATFQFDPSAIGAVASAPNSARPNLPPGVPPPPPPVRAPIGPGVGPQPQFSNPVTQLPRQVTPQPGIVNSPNNSRPPIRAAPPSAPSTSAPRIIAQPTLPAPPRPALPGANSANDDDDD